MPSRRIPSLEAARGIAALMVVAVHVNSFHALDHVPQDSWLHFTSYGWLGVEVFFVLSGLVLFLPYARGDRQLELGSYLTARVLRIVPGLWVALIVSAALFGMWSWALVRHGLFVNGRADTVVDPIPPSWSLTIEMGFYLLLPLLVWVFARRPVFTESSCFSHCYAWGRFQRVVARWLPDNPARLYGHLRRRRSRRDRCRPRRIATSLDASRGRLASCAAGLSITGVIGIEWGTATALVGPLFAIALAIAALASNSVPRSLVWLGTVSYGIYLWHWPVLKFTTAHGLYRLPDSVEIVVVAVLSITLGWLSWKIVEMPALRLRPQVVRLLRTDKPDGGLPGTGRVAADHD